mgnify:CR=1 FL=1
MKNILFSKKAKVIRRIIIGSVLAVIAAFVAFNLYGARDIETVDQTVVPENTVPAVPSDQAPVEVAIRRGSFVGLNGYSVSGDAVVTDTAGVRRLVLQDNFVASNGPDVLVYLTKNDAASEGGALVEPISLGPIQSFSGTQTYVLPDNSEEYSSVVIWCRAFSVAFGAVSL